MSESVVERLPIPNESDHSPPKNPTDEDFDPVQAILDAGKRCREEEQRRSETGTNQPNNKAIQEKKESDNLSPGESEDDEDSDTIEEPSDKYGSKRPDGSEVKVVKSSKKTGKKKNKSSSLRRNIKDILKHDQLDDLTIAARKEEEERRQRMNLKLQQLQQQQLKFLQEQQTYLLRESLLSASGYNQLNPPSHSVTELKKLIRKRHKTVSLDASGKPISNQEDEECILLSSDDDCDNLPKPVGSVPLLPSSCVPSQISAFSDEENSEHDRNRLSSKDSRLYVGAINDDRIVQGGSAGAESDDDCVIVSPEPEGDEEIEEKDECSQDLLNVPDQFGRVLVNVGHPDGDTDLFLAPQIAKIIKPHQIGGVRFLYDNVVESKDRYNESSGFGCILAHAMGLGKTLQTVAFCDVLLRTVGKTVLIIVPINTIQNWLNEFNRYLPSKDISCSNSSVYVKRRSGKNKVKRSDCVQNGSGSPEKPSQQTTDDVSSTPDLSLNLGLYPNLFNLHENQVAPSSSNTLNNPPEIPIPLEASEPEPTTSCDPALETNVHYRHFDVYLLNETVKSLQARERIITTWTSKGGVLLLGYEMYRMLALKRLKKSSRKVLSLDHEERLAEAESLSRIYDCLVEPGPDCVICDEGHRIKNSGAGISQALKAIKTKRRVVLTGYPLQNNLMEYW
ncbi:Helicase ARIP4 [Orchesella cincta]|uniref:Helicase ARIP4 n=1 Tax=Orchesella cincta TaxID=48709 RepID=A0A1D2MP87_ORCCI|nr:Helicase ARIP4 [Orchesella cincta]